MSPRFRFRLPFRSAKRRRAELEEELGFHLEMRARELTASGMAADAAREQARREFGDLEQTRDYCAGQDTRGERGQRLRTTLAETAEDARFAVRQLRRDPGFAVVAILTLALGIGANAAIFSAVHHILIAALPYPDQDRVVTLWQHDAQAGTDVPLSPGNFVDWRERARTLRDVAVAVPYGFRLTATGADPVTVGAWNVTEGFFAALGAEPLHGRTFLAGEHDSGAARVVVLGHRLWDQRYARDPGIVGRTITLDGAPYQVIGVMGPRFRYPEPAGVYTPVSLRADTRNRFATYVRGVARLAPGATLGQAREESERLWRALGDEFPRANRQMSGRVIPIEEYLTSGVRPVLLTLLGAAVLVLLIACTNVANLLLARGVSRQRELALRVALGAGRGRIARQLLGETAVLSAAGLTAGIAIAYAAVGGIRRFAPADLPRVEEVRLDAPVLLFTIAITLATALAAGLAPALQGARSAIGRSLASRNLLRHGISRGFVLAQVALAVVLLISAGLLVRSMTRVLDEDLGFAPGGRVALTVHVWDAFPDPVRRGAWVQQASAALAALPGVASAGAANALPLSHEGSDMDPPFTVVGGPPLAPGEEPTAVMTIATPGYFPALGIALRSGRLFDERDGPGAPPVMLISETMARRFFPGENPVGRAVAAGAASQPLERTIVGVVADVRHASLEVAPRPEIYVPHAQVGFGSVTFVVHAPRGADALPTVAQRAITALHSGVVFSGVERLDVRLAETLAPRRFTLLLMGVFAALAVLLSAIGLYGVLSFAVAQRSSELGVRMALGADASMVMRLVLGEGVFLAGLGVAAGIAIAVALTRVLRGLLYGIEPTDPLTFVLLAAVALLTATIACWIPARRAARVNPLEAIRL